MADLKAKKRQIIGNMEHLFEMNVFNRDSVKSGEIYGRVFQLFSLHKNEFLEAIEVACGNKLFSVSVENENVASELIQGKLIAGRCEYVPNNKIRGNTIDPNILSLAYQIAKDAGEQVWNPLELIEFKPELAKTFEFIFGDKLIVSSFEIAKEIAFNPKIRKICITKKGDIIQPSGVREGGFVGDGNRFLPKCFKFKELSQEIEKLLKQNDEAIASQTNNTNKQERLISLKSQIRVLREKLLEFERGGEELEFEKNSQEIKTTKSNIERIEIEINHKSSRISEIEKNIVVIRADQKLPKNDQSKVVARRLKAKEDELGDTEKSINSLKSKIEELKVTLNDLREENKSLEQETRQTSVEEETLRIDHEGIVSRRDVCIKRMEELEKQEKKRLNEQEREERVLTDLNYQKEENDIQLERLKEELEAKENGLKRANELKEELKNKLFSRNSQKAQNTPPNTPNLSPNESIEQLMDQLKVIEKKEKQMKNETESIEKRVNVDCELEYNRLKERYGKINLMKDEVNSNKETLINNVQNLDMKKKEAVQKCFESVNKNLGEIFRSFLPGADAKMRITTIIDKKTKLEKKGVEMMIAFNQKWKEGLTELSGGQRSLLALSFMLAMLRYRPAPFYILDEVDSALDLSHTENLGLQISTHFPQSQFIVISLKEQLFNNANLLFKVSVSEGRSAIERYKNKIN